MNDNIQIDKELIKLRNFIKKTKIFHFYKSKFFYFKQKKNINLTQKHYKQIAEKLKKRGQTPIRFACYVMYATDFAEKEVFSIMINDDDFDPKVVIIPDISRGQKHMISNYNETKRFLENKFGNNYLLDGYDVTSNSFFDFSDKFDIIAMNNPYDEMAHKFHRIEYLCKKNLLLISTTYAFLALNYTQNHIFPRFEFNLLWKYFIDTEYGFKECKQKSLYKAKNVLVYGYPKMDTFAKCIETQRIRKRIIIAPHHTVNVSSLPLSNFMKYYNLIPELPDLFPEIDFIFRPHPLLFTNLINKRYWTEKQVTNYLTTIKSKNIIYSTDGDYLELFKNSDAIIHDCGSYITEWLFTGKPCCFVANDKSIFNFFSPLGLECIKNYTIAYSREQIIDFIKNVMDNNISDYPNQEILKNKVMINYPNVSQRIVNYLKLR